MRSRQTSQPSSLSYTVHSLNSKALGKIHFAAVWDQDGWRSLIFPEADKKQVVARALAKFPLAKNVSLKTAPAVVRKEFALVADYLNGKKANLTKIRLNLSSLPPFHQRVYREALNVTCGSTKSYMTLAQSLGQPGAARAVGQAMARNPLPLIVPCHRVLASANKLGGFTAPGGLESKKRLLAMEGYAEPSAKRFPAGVRPEKALASRCERMKKLISEIGEFKKLKSSSPSVYAALFRSILFQQLNGRAAQTILDRVKADFGGEVPEPKALLKTKLGYLRQFGVSGNKELALRDLALKTVEGIVPNETELKKLDDEEIISRLTQIRGVGRWTVEMLLIFHLGRPDVWPVDDFAIRAATGRLFGLKKMPSGKEIKSMADAWRPYRSVASWYLWRSQDLK